jgi:ElaB/YqjD/DUF883 family membrane-anchored ribosome-binding protein
MARNLDSAPERLFKEAAAGTGADFRRLRRAKQREPQMATSPNKTARIDNGPDNGPKVLPEPPAPKSGAAADMEMQIQTLKEEIAKLRAQIASSGERSFGALRNIAADGAEQLRSQGEAAMDDLKDSARDLEAQLTATVREKPVTSLAIAAGVGFLFALIARR